MEQVAWLTLKGALFKPFKMSKKAWPFSHVLFLFYGWNHLQVPAKLGCLLQKKLFWSHVQLACASKPHFYGLKPLVLSIFNNLLTSFSRPTCSAGTPSRPSGWRARALSKPPKSEPSLAATSEDSSRVSSKPVWQVSEPVSDDFHFSKACC
jgi:hypothetical protein